MKTINNIIIGVALFGSVLVAKAVDPFTRSFINPSYRGLYVSNSATFLTNLTSTVISVPTNMNPVVATNNAGVAVATNNIWYVNLLGTVNIPATESGLLNTNLSLFVRVPSAKAGAAATNGFLLIFAPCPNGTNDSTQAADFLQVSNGVGNTAVAGNWEFNFTPRPGVRAYMLQKVGSVAAPTAAASQFEIDEISLNGQQP